MAVFTADWSLVSWNPSWSALQGDPNMIPPAHRNLARVVFGDDEARRWLRPSRSQNGAELFAAAIAADLKAAAITYPTDPGLVALVMHLRRANPSFDALWRSGKVAHHQPDRKTIEHPDVGPITLDCDVLTVPGADLRLVVYSAPANTSDATKLDFLRVTQGVATHAAPEPGAAAIPSA